MKQAKGPGEQACEPNSLSIAGHVVPEQGSSNSLQRVFERAGHAIPTKGKVTVGRSGPAKTRPAGSQPAVHDRFEDNEIYECGAMLLALIAYPEDDANDTKRSNAFGSLCAFALRAYGDRAPFRRDVPDAHRYLPAHQRPI